MNKEKTRIRFLKVGSVAHRVLLTVLENTKGGVSFGWEEFLKNNPAQRAVWGSKYKEYRRSLAYLQRKGFLEILPGGNVRITKRAEIEKIRNQILKKQNPKTWDEKWRLVMFDIPEKKRSQRDFLREKLNYLGFCELQRSIWLTPYDIESEIKEFVGLVKNLFEGDIRFATVERFDREEDLLEKFNLKREG